MDDDVIANLVEEGVFTKDCQILLKYAQSEIASNKCLALQHITTLASEDRAFRDHFNKMGAYESLCNSDPSVGPCEVQYRGRLISSSRQALNALSPIDIPEIRIGRLLTIKG